MAKLRHHPVPTVASIPSPMAVAGVTFQFPIIPL